MGRLKLYSRSVLSGHFFILVNIFYSLFSVPIALHYLSKAEFGLWAVVMQLAGFFLLLDTGISSALGRLLIDAKDARPTPEYGKTFLAAFFALCGMGTVILAVGLPGSSWAVGLMNIPEELRDRAWVLFIMQILFSAVSLPARAIGNTLVAYGRFDLLNLCFSVSVAGSFLALWAALHYGAGVYSLAYANATGLVITVGGTTALAIKMGLLPRRRELAWPTWREFREVVGFGHSIFLNQVGGTLLFASQAIVLSKFAGLEAAGIWSVGSKAFLLCLQFASKFLESPGPIISEMFVRGETGRLRQRLAQLKTLSVSVGLWGGSVLWACNTSFVQIWTHGKVVWHPGWDALLMIFLTTRLLAQSLGIYIGASKDFGFFRYSNLVEAVVFLALCWFLVPAHGVGGMISASILSSLAVSIPYLEWRNRQLGAMNIFPGREKMLFSLFLAFPILGAALAPRLLGSFSALPHFALGLIVQMILGIPLFLFLADKLGILARLKPKISALVFRLGRGVGRKG